MALRISWAFFWGSDSSEVLKIILIQNPKDICREEYPTISLESESKHQPFESGYWTHAKGSIYSFYLEVESQDCIIWSSWLHVLSIFLNSWFHPFKTPHGPLFVVKANHESGRMLTKMHSEHICVVVLVNRFDSILSWICTILSDKSVWHKLA